jgi:hypothetical protein
MKLYNFLLLALLFSKCFPGLGPKKGIDVFNNTDSILYVAYSFNDSLDKDYPLVLIKEAIINNEKQRHFPCYRLDAHSRGSIGIPGRELLLQDCDNKMLRLFFILESTMRDYGWEEICEQRMFEKKLTFTEVELKESDWVVVYE